MRKQWKFSKLCTIVICGGHHISIVKIHIVLIGFHVSISYGVRHNHLCDFALSKCNNTVLLRRTCEFFRKLELVRARPKLALNYINTNIYIYSGTSSRLFREGLIPGRNLMLQKGSKKLKKSALYYNSSNTLGNLYLSIFKGKICT